MADDFVYDNNRFVLIAKVGRAHGIKGELKMHSFSGQQQSITRHRKLFLVSIEGQLLPVFDVVRSRHGNKETLVQLQGVNDRNGAERLSGFGVLVEKRALPELKDGEFYLHELEGLLVKTEDGKIVGTVHSFFNNGMQDLLVVRKGVHEVMIPLVPSIITARDAHCLIISPPSGLLELNDDEGAKGVAPHDI